MRRRTFVIRTSQAAAGLGILRSASACHVSTTGDFATLRSGYMKRMLELNPVTSTYLGGDGYDPSLAAVNGQLRDYSQAAVDREVAWLRDIQARLARAGSLAGADAVDHGVMDAQAGYLIHQLANRRYHQRCVDSYVAEPFRGVDWQMQQMTDAGGGLLGTQDEWALVVRRLRAVPAYLDTARANLLAGKAAGNLPDRRMVRKDGIAGADANTAYFKTALPAVAARYLGSRPFASQMKSDITAAGALASDAFAAFSRFLASTYDLEEATDRFAAGEAEYTWRVANCLRETRTPAQLYDYGAQQVELYEGQIYQVAQEVAQAAHLGLRFDTPDAKRASVRGVMDYLSKDAPRNDDELFAWYRDAADRAVAYGRAQQMFDIPATYRLDIIPTPEVLRSSGGASYYPAPPFKKSGVGRFYLTPTGNDAAALKLNNRASIADTAVHEGFPGHDWNFKYMTEHAAEISPVRWLTPGAVEDSFSMWEDSMASEGWGLYAEELMAQPADGKPHGFYTPAEHLYELQGQLLRAVRVRVDVGIHTGRMSFDDAVDYFAEHVEFYPGARAAARRDPTARAIMDEAGTAMYRYSKWPTQAITYNLGKNAIVDLREAVRAKQGAAFTAKTFHERFMAEGTIPPGYFRDQLLA